MVSIGWNNDIVGIEIERMMVEEKPEIQVKGGLKYQRWDEKGQDQFWCHLDVERRPDSGTPMTQTALNPSAAIWSHSSSGSEASVIQLPVFRLTSSSQTQALIS